MQVTIHPSKAKGNVSAPPSKSIAHRALICGALTDGCVIENCGNSQDIQATLRCLQALGATVEMSGDRVKIGGLNPFSIPEQTMLDCGESGSTLRFLLPLCLLSGQKVTLCGHGRLMQRPMDVYEELCRTYGFLFEKSEHSISVCGQLKSGTYIVPGNLSSQFITGLILALAQLPGESRVEVAGNFESSSYVNITLSVLCSFGIAVKRVNNTYILNGNQRFLCERFSVEGDCSNAAFLDAFNLLDGCVKVSALSPKTSQGDWVYKQMFTDLASGKREFDLSDCPDLGPVMFALSAALGGAQFTGTERLRIKESDRCASMAEELSKFGISSIIEKNSVTIQSGNLTAPLTSLYGHNDHRIVMALSLLCSLTGGTIEGAEAVAKSYPNYFEVIQSLGIELKTDDIS